MARMLLLIRWSAVRIRPGEPLKSIIYKLCLMSILNYLPIVCYTIRTPLKSHRDIRRLDCARLLDTASTESNLRGPLAAACGKPHNGEGHDRRVTAYSV